MKRNPNRTSEAGFAHHHELPTICVIIGILVVIAVPAFLNRNAPLDTKCVEQIVRPGEDGICPVSDLKYEGRKCPAPAAHLLAHPEVVDGRYRQTFSGSGLTGGPTELSDGSFFWATRITVEKDRVRIEEHKPFLLRWIVGVIVVIVGVAATLAYFLSYNGDVVGTIIWGALIILFFSFVTRVFVHDRNVEIHPEKVVLQHTWFGFEIGQREEIEGVKALFAARLANAIQVRILTEEDHVDLFRVSEEEYLKLAPVHRLLFPKSLTAKPSGG